MRASCATRGTTLIEILIAVVFLGICATVILDMVATSDLQSSYALRRSQVVNALQQELEAARGSAVARTIGSSVTQHAVSLTGFSGPVTVQTTISLRPNSTRLYDVTSVATWTEETSTYSRPETMQLQTIVKT